MTTSRICDMDCLDFNKCPSLYQQKKKNQTVHDHYHFCDEVFIKYYLSSSDQPYTIYPKKQLTISELIELKNQSKKEMVVLIFCEIVCEDIVIKPHATIIKKHKITFVAGMPSYIISAQLKLLAAIWACAMKKENVYIESYLAITVSKHVNEKVKQGSWLKSKNITFHALKRIEKVERILMAIQQHQIAEKSCGSACFKPEKCMYLSQCWNADKSTHIFNLIESSFLEKIELFNNGIITFKDYLNTKPTLTKKQQTQIESEITNKVICNQKKCTQFLASLKGNMQTFDIEVFQKIENHPTYVKAFQKVPFIFSYHQQIKEEEPAHHQLFCQEPNQTNLRIFTKKMCEVISEESSIIVFDGSLEKEIFKQCMNAFPEYTKKITNIQNQIVDLADLFRCGAIYIPNMKGRVSLKSIYYAIKPQNHFDNCELQSGLDLVKKVAKYSEMTSTQQKHIIHTCSQYCQSDTLAIMHIVQWLKKEITIT